ncbi:CXXC1 [Mytilus coruscus]|uniref:CXXC1 n=1 Tax=Mytilus coruscus TaxID=42192 RepID=A0A6J8A6T6_MYTCO|nr:CXXC1 [Mytilus coruscus]
MIQCDFCDEWYHGACIDLTPELADTVVKFRCPRKRPSNEDENSWPTPSEAYEGTPLPLPPGEQRGEGREDHVQQDSVIKTELSDVPEEDVLDLHNVNYIDWTDIQVPQEPAATVVAERDSSRFILRTYQTDIVVSADGSGNRSVKVPAVKGPEVKVPEVQGPEVQGPEVKMQQEGNKQSICPILTCGQSTKKLKHHYWQYHLPYIFKDRSLDEFEKDPAFQKLRRSAIQTLATWIVGPRATVYDLVRNVNSTPNFLPYSCMMMQRCQDQIRNLTAVMNWYPPAEDSYTMYPVNSLAVLMQWQILITLLAQLSPINTALPKLYKSSRPTGTDGRHRIPQTLRQSGKARVSTPVRLTAATVSKTLSDLQSKLANTLDARESLNRKRQSRDSSRLTQK